MELLQLQYFQTVAQLENISHAAGVLHVSQPALTKMIQRLERDVGTPLFDREKKRIRLNECGRVYLARVQEAFRALEEGQRELEDLAAKGQRTIRVGTASPHLLPELLTAYLKTNPHASFESSHIIDKEDLKRQLLEGTVDLAFSYGPVEETEICGIEMVREQLLLAVSRTHPLAERQSVSLKELAQEAFITLPPVYDLSQCFTACCREAGFTPRITSRIASLDIIAELVATGLGAALLPDFCQKRRDPGTLVFLPVKESSAVRSIWLSWNQKRYMTKAVRQFVDFLKKIAVRCEV